MSKIDLGSVSAFDIAVKNGYAGTEADWVNDIANASENAEAAAESAESARQYAQTAETAAEESKTDYESVMSEIDYLSDKIDGFEPPEVSVTQTGEGAEISVTDASGTTTATVYNGTATDEQVADWLDNHPEATTTVQDGSITTPKMNQEALNYISSGKLAKIKRLNLLNNTTFTDGRLNTDGTIASTSDYKVTDYIPVTELQFYKGVNLDRCALYASDKTFVSMPTASFFARDYGHPIASGASYIRIDVSNANLSTAIFDEYEYYTGQTDGYAVTGVSDNMEDFVGKGLTPLGESNNVMFAKGINLADAYNDDLYVCGTSQVSISPDDGTLDIKDWDYKVKSGAYTIPNNGCISCGTYIPVTAGQVLFCNYELWNSAYYDSNKAYLGKITWPTTSGIGWIVPEGCAYVRLNFKAYHDSTSATWLKSLDDYKKVVLYCVDTTERRTPTPRYYTTPYQLDGAIISPNYLDKVEPNMIDSSFLSAMKCLAIREVNKRDHAYRIGNFNMWVSTGVSGWDMTRKMLMDYGVDFCGFQEVSTYTNNVPADFGVFMESWQFADGFSPTRSGGTTDNPLSIVSRYAVQEWSEWEMTSAPSNKFCVNAKIQLPRYLDVYEPKKILSLYTIHPPITTKTNLVNIATELLGVIANDESDYIVVVSDTNDYGDQESDKSFWNTMNAGGMAPVIPIDTKTITQDSISQQGDEYPSKQWRHNSVDQIFISSNIECVGFDVVNTKEEYAVTGISSGATDNEPALSDHDFVFADLVFKNEERQ